MSPSGAALFTIVMRRPDEAPHVELGPALAEQAALFGTGMVHTSVSDICRDMANTTVRGLVDRLIAGDPEMIAVVRPGTGDFVARVTYYAEVAGTTATVEIEQGAQVTDAPLYARFVLLVHALVQSAAFHLLVSAVSDENRDPSAGWPD